MNIVDLSIKKPVAVTMICLALVLFGLMAYFNLPVSLLPDTSVPVVSVQTVYGGASPLTIETQLTKKIEDQVFSIAELDSVTSYSMDSASIVVAVFKDGKDENLALQEVKDKVDALAADLPAAAKKPVISKMNATSGSSVMDIIIEGNMSSTQLYEYASTVVKDQLSQVTGVGSVDLSVGEEREIRVDLHDTPVFTRFLPVQQIAGILAQANMEVPGGNVVFEGQDIPVRFKGEFNSIEEINDTDVPTRAGVFKLRQLARVYDSKTVVRERTIFNDVETGKRNENALLIKVMKNPSANTISVIDGITKRIPQIERDSGNTIRLNVIKEDAKFIRDSVNDAFGNLILGIILTALVLMIFLHDWRSTVIISIAMPFSIISTFLVMQFMKISINVLSLMGLSCAVGTLVASSVIVLENIFRLKEEGRTGDRPMTRAEAASAGTKEVIIAVIGATMTHVAVFVPLGGMKGSMGQILGSFAYTVVISAVFSLVVSVTVTPLLASRLLSEKTKEPGKLSKNLDAFFKKLEELYGRSISFLVTRRRRSAAFIAVVLVVFVISILGFSQIKMELIPKSDGGRIQVSVELPQGSSLDMTAAVLAEIGKRLAAYPEVQTILTTLGNAGAMNRDVSVAQMNVALVPKSQRAKSNDLVAVAMTKTLSDIPGADIKVVAQSEMTITDGAPIDLYLKGTDSAVLQGVADKLRSRFAAVPGITNVAINTKAGKQELVFEPNRKQILQDGLTVQTVAMSLRFAIDGIVSTTYREGSQSGGSGSEYDIRVKMSDDSLKDIEDIRNIPIVAASGIYPLSRYADVHFENGYNMIMRVNKLQAIEISADTLPGYTQGGVLAGVMSAVGEIDMPAGCSLSQAGLSDSMSSAIIDMGVVFITAIVLMYLLLAVILENAVQPLFILSAVPLSIIGVTAACLLTGTVLNNIAMIGIIMLIGIVTTNSILLLDHYNKLKREGLNVRDALVRACPAKLKAILMSNIAVIMGIIPMALGIGASLAEMRQPMGIVITGGIISSMIMILWLIPCLEFVLNGKKKSKESI